MKKKQEQKIATGLAVHTNLVAGSSCAEKGNGGAFITCFSQYDDRAAQGIDFTKNLQELDRCLNSC
jgi:hypothetical protein